MIGEAAEIIQGHPPRKNQWEASQDFDADSAAKSVEYLVTMLRKSRNESMSSSPSSHQAVSPTAGEQSGSTAASGFQNDIRLLARAEQRYAEALCDGSTAL